MGNKSIIHSDPYPDETVEKIIESARQAQVKYKRRITILMEADDEDLRP